MEYNDNNFKIIKEFLLKDIRIFLMNKLLILEKEIYNLKWSINYVFSLEKLNNNEKSQFYFDCKFIQENIGETEDSVDSKSLLAKIKEIKNELNNVEKLENYDIYELIIIFDCIHDRINTSLLKKFEYLHKAYENLILSYNPLYIPNPTISKLAKTPNLMLYFNKHLNNVSCIMEYLTNSNKQKDIFSTWNFIHIDHAQSINDSNNNIPLEFSFWLYEMPIFHCIAFHEIYHKYYFDDIKVKIDDIAFFANNIPLSVRNIISLSKTVVYNLYQEILADLHAFIFAKDAYLYTFFLTGFLRNIYKSFYKDFNVNNPIKTNERCCFNRHEKFSIYGFDYDIDKINFFIRLKILLKFREIILKDDNKTFVTQIKTLLEIVFPSKNCSLYNFDVLLSNFIEYKNYSFFRAVLNLLYETYDKYLYEKKIYDTLKKRYEFITDKKQSNLERIKDNKKKEKYKTCFSNLKCKDYEKLFKDYINKILKFDIKDKEISQIAEINFSSQEEFRKKNLKNIFSNENFNESNKIYYLTFIKVSRLGKDDSILEIFDLFNNLNKQEKQKYYYAFGPYDFVRLEEKKYTFLTEIEKELDNCKFFIDNHSLILLTKKDDNIETNFNEIFNLIVALDIKNIFNNEDNNEQILLNSLKEILSKWNKNHKIFMSMGNEHMVLFIENLNQQDLTNILDDIHSINNIHTKNENKILLNDISSTILFNSNIFEDNENIDNIEINDLVILLKLIKNTSLKENYKTLKAILQEQNFTIFPYKKYGVYDAKIFIEKITLKELKSLIQRLSSICMDIQIEKENKINIQDD